MEAFPRIGCSGHCSVHGITRVGDNSRLRIAAASVFIAGLIKYSERTWALHSASMDQLRNLMVRDPDPGPNYAEFVEEYV